jgi:hypothetical protein
MKNGETARVFDRSVRQTRTATKTKTKGGRWGGKALRLVGKGGPAATNHVRDGVELYLMTISVLQE